MLIAIRKTAASIPGFDEGSITLTFHPKQIGADILCGTYNAHEYSFCYPLNPIGKVTHITGQSSDAHFNTHIVSGQKPKPRSHPFMQISVMVHGPTLSGSQKCIFAAKQPLEQWCADGVEIGGVSTPLSLTRQSICS